MSVGIIRNVIKSSDLPTSIHTFADVQKVLNAGKETEMLTVGMEMDEVTVGSEPMVWIIGNIASGEVIFVPKWCLATTREMNSAHTNVGGWNSSALRAWLNGDFYNSLPDTVKPYIKSRTFKTSAGNQSTSLQSATDKIWLPREWEIFGATTYAAVTEHTDGGAEQFSIFATSANRIKTAGKAGSACNWWESSPYAGNATSFCIVDTTRSANNNNAASSAIGVAPCFRMTPDGGGVELVDINPDQETNTNAQSTTDISVCGIMCVGTTYITGSPADGSVSYLPINGYSKISIKNLNAPSYTLKWRFINSDGTTGTLYTASSSWSDYYDIPKKAIAIQLFGYYTSVSFLKMCYSLLA